MKRMSSRIGIMVATVGLAVAVGPSAYAGPHPLTVRTPPLAPDPGGYLYCRVVATRRHEDVGAGHEGHVGAAATDAHALQ